MLGASGLRGPGFRVAGRFCSSEAPECRMALRKKGQRKGQITHEQQQMECKKARCPRFFFGSSSIGQDLKLTSWAAPSSPAQTRTTLRLKLP